MIDRGPHRCPDASLPLGHAFDLCGMTLQQLYWASVALGGSLPPPALAAALSGDGRVDARAHDVLAQALNEALMDVGRAERVALTARLGPQSAPGSWGGTGEGW